jgi:mono/diheme cytochrome c family protein
MKARWLLLPVALASACQADVPDSPTYFDDVQPIVRANCARCHGADVRDPKISKFRLDRYVKGDDATFDLWDYAQASGAEVAPIVRVAVNHEAPVMPPDYALTDRQREILARWVDQGAPKGARSNRAAEISLVSPTDAATADQVLEVTFRAWDADLDGLTVQLWAHDLAANAAQDVPLGSSTGAGERSVTIDTGALASKHQFEIYAILDDGFSDDPEENRAKATLLPRLAVDHGARGTAPTVKLLAPNGGEALVGQADVTWTATDPDAGDTLTIDLELIRADTGEVAASLASGIPNTGAFRWTIPESIPVAEGGVPIPYEVRVSATDLLGTPPNVRRDSSDTPLTIVAATDTSLTWEDVKPIFVTYCIKCHGQPARTMSLESFRLDKYDASDPEAPTNSDLGVFEMKGSVYQRMISSSNMPPAAEPQPSAQELQNVGNWIQGGAPKGGGPSDARPTFTWVRPSSTQTGSPTVVLQWNATDAEGLASGRIEYAKINGNPATGCANTTNATWMPINDPKASATLMGSMSWADSFVWSIPTTPSGYFCVRGLVTDVANQTAMVVNSFGIK